VRTVKRMLVVLGGAVLGGLLSTVPVFASGPEYPPQPPEAPAPAPEIAVTGGDITVGVLLLVGLIVVGIVALMLGRRRVRVGR
jgi:LPXTG-motif cell wall-anchored protein